MTDKIIEPCLTSLAIARHCPKLQRVFPATPQLYYFGPTSNPIPKLSLLTLHHNSSLHHKNELRLHSRPSPEPPLPQTKTLRIPRPSLRLRLPPSRIPILAPTAPAPPHRRRSTHPRQPHHLAPGNMDACPRERCRWHVAAAVEYVEYDDGG